MGFLGTIAGPFADITLIVQVTGFIILLSGIMHAKKKDFPAHFKMADTAVTLGILSFIWMGYSFSRNIQAIIPNLTTLHSLLTVLHTAVGIPALLAGISFILNRFIKKTRSHMRITSLLWTAALFIGIALYAVYYV